MAITVKKGLIGKEDISFNPAGTTPETFTRDAAGGTSQTITKLAPRHLNIEDSGNYFSATTVEAALQEVASDINGLQEVADAGKGADIASASVLSLPDNSLYFEVTGTTQINSILQATDPADGRLVVLQFQDSLLVESTAALKLKEGRFTTQAGDFLVCINDGLVWHELTRWRDHGWKLHTFLELREVELAEGLMYASGRDIDRPDGVHDDVPDIGKAFSTDAFGERF